MSDVRGSSRATRGLATLPRKGASQHGRGSHEYGVHNGDVDAPKKYTSGGRVIYRGKGGLIIGKRNHGEHRGEGSLESPIGSAVTPRHTLGTHTVHRGGGSHEYGVGSGNVDSPQKFTSRGHTAYRGKGGLIIGKRKHGEYCGVGSHESPIDSVVSPGHTLGIHTIHRGGELDRSPDNSVAASGHTSGRHNVHHVGGIDNSPISSDVVASRRHITRGPDEIAHDDAYDDNEGHTHRPSRQNMFDIGVPRNTSGKKFIERIGNKFADHDVHGHIKDILLEHFDAPWATFKMVPKNVLATMFARFGTLYCWDPENEKLIYDAFINVIKDRFRDIMSEWRLQSKKKAEDVGHVFGDTEHGFDIIYQFPPDSVSETVWEQLCLGWNTEKWLNKSVSGRNNRTKEGNGDAISRHTGGSIGFDERRIRLEKEHGRKIKWIEVFFDTHLKKESKKKYWAGELNINSLEGFEFCTKRSKQAYVKYRNDMIKLHGSDISQHPDDLDVWTNVARGSRGRMFGIGSSDPHFVVTGKPSTSTRSASYFGELRSQEEVQKVRAEMEEELENERRSRNELEERVQRMEQLEKEVEDERKSRNELEERVRRMEHMEKERKENEERRQKQFDEFMRNIQPPGSNY